MARRGKAKHPQWMLMDAHAAAVRTADKLIAAARHKGAPNPWLRDCPELRTKIENAWNDMLRMSEAIQALYQECPKAPEQ